MKILAFSDIHGNMGAVRKLRAQETNDFDAIIIAGDIGNESHAELQSIVSTFNCPVYFVYGNWDNEAQYDALMIPSFHLVHHNVLPIGNNFVTGFSGCPTHWGQNPIYVDLKESLEAKHAEVRAARRKLQERIRAEVAHAQLEWRVVLDQKIKRLQDRSADKRKKLYKDRLRSYEETAKEKVAIVERRCRKDLTSFEQTPAWKAYRYDRGEAKREALKQNRERLDAILREIDPCRTIVITHERQFRLAETSAAPLLHVYGHAHTFKHTQRAGRHSLNAAALDALRTVVPIDASCSSSDPVFDQHIWSIVNRESLHTANIGGYCVVRIRGDSVGVERRTLLIDESRWRPLRTSFNEAPLLPGDDLSNGRPTARRPAA